MHPILFQSGLLILSSWHVFFMLAAWASWFTLQRWYPYVWPSAKAYKIDSFFLLAYTSGYFGARALSLMLEDEQSCLCWASLLALFNIGSMTLYGGIIAAAFTCLMYAKVLKLPTRQLADVLLPPTLIGIAVGRIGCLLNGDDYGLPIGDQLHPAFWAVRFANLEDGLYRYPVQIFESGLCLALAFICWANRSKNMGVVGSIGIIGYAGLRFGLEFLRGDERGHFLTPVLSPAQLISLGVSMAWLVFLRITQKSTLAV